MQRTSRPRIIRRRRKPKYLPAFDQIPALGLRRRRTLKARIIRRRAQTEIFARIWQFWPKSGYAQLGFRGRCARQPAINCRCAQAEIYARIWQLPAIRHGVCGDVAPSSQEIRRFAQAGNICQNLPISSKSGYTPWGFRRRRVLSQGKREGPPELGYSA